MPAQALGLMNHPFVHQQAEVHAKRLLNEAGTDIEFERSLEKWWTGSSSSWLLPPCVPSCPPTSGL